MGEWVEQQHQLQRAGDWKPRTISAEAANRDLEARLSRAIYNKRATETRLADVTKERDRLATGVKTLERDLGTAHIFIYEYLYKYTPPPQAWAV